MNRRRRTPIAWLALFALLLAASVAPAASQRREASEYAVKAAFVLKFGEYVEWPAAAFVDGGSPLRIGVVGAEALARELEQLAEGRTLAGRPVQVQRLAAGDPVAGLQLLFVGGDAADGGPMLLASAAQPTLTITEAAAGVPAGSVINFVIVDAKVRFDVALPAADARRLKISSRLLAVARTVGDRR